GRGGVKARWGAVRARTGGRRDGRRSPPLREVHRQAPRAPAGPGIEDAGAGRAAFPTTAELVETPGDQLEPVATDEQHIARVAVGTAAGFVMDVAGVDVA